MVKYNFSFISSGNIKTDDEGNIDSYMITFKFNSGMNYSLKGKNV
ncbi:hypothetical protein [Romboutsia maritimum]|nr:hypothetical protein [Romboutsia maritimum]